MILADVLVFLQRRWPKIANCYACKAEIVFDNEHIGKNGKKIPLDPFTKQPHDCPMREKKPFSELMTKEVGEDKDDHGNEDSTPMHKNFSRYEKWPDEKPTEDKYVDHTIARPSKVKIFHAENSDLVEIQYNEFLKSKTFQWTKAQLGAKGNEWAIALYYEETKQ